MWENKAVLVTGGGGFIGSQLVERLVLAGAKVRAFVRYTSRNDLGLLYLAPPEIRSEIEFVAGDLRDGLAVKKAVDGCDYVFHLGALISIPYSYLHPVEVVETNILGTLNVLNACREGSIKRLIHTSTSEVYGTAQHVPMDESHPLQGQSPYSASKIGADMLAESFYNAYELPVVTLRPFNTYGPRQSARAVIPTIITQAIANQTIRLGNLETTRDFTFVDDTVNGFLKAAEVDNVDGGVFNLGTGQEIRIGELAELIINKVGSDAKIVEDRHRMRPNKSEVQRLLSNNAYIQETMGWQPKYSLQEGLTKTIDWIKDHLELFDIGSYQI